MRYYQVISSLAIAALSCNGVLADGYGYNHVPVNKDNDKVEEAFPDPDVKLRSPAFLSPDTIPSGFEDGTEGPTDEKLLDKFLQHLAKDNDWMKYEVANFTSGDGRSFPYVRLSAQDQKRGNNEEKVRIWVEGAMHGNEPAGDQSVLAFLGKMAAEQKWAASLLEKADFLVLPRYNPDGVFYFQRRLAVNLDPNRDHIKLAEQQTRDLKAMFGEFAPHVAIDMHEYSGTSRYGPDEDLIMGADALFSSAKNPNIDSKIRKMSEELFAKRIGKDQEKGGFRWEPYVTDGGETDGVITLDEAGSDAKIGRNSMGMSQSITFLCETRGIGLADQEFKRRTASALQMLLSIVETAVENAEDVYETVEGGVKRFMESTEDIIVTDSRQVEDREFTMVRETDGSVIQEPVKFASATPTKANLTRTRPEAYLIPRGWTEVAARMAVLGLKVEPLEDGYNGPVEALNITSVEFDDEYYEGAVRATVEAEPIETDVKLPPGSLRVSTRQKNAALMFAALEPESIDSYATFNIIPLEVGDEYPIFRIMK